MSLAGQWRVRLKDGTAYDVRLPGSLDENGVGGPDTAELSSRLTRLHVYEGPACFEKRVTLACAAGHRLFVVVERARFLSLTVDGWPVPARSGSLSTAWTFEVTRFADGAAHDLRLVSDNSYPGGPRDEILYSSAATDETQTNWNGLLGQVALAEQPRVFVSGLRLLMGQHGDRVCVTVDADARWQGQLRVTGPALSAPVEKQLNVPAGRTDITLLATVSSTAPRWDEGEGSLSSVTAELSGQGQWTQRCGVRVFCGNEAGRLTLNGRVFFLRGEANCCEFPETGHPPMTVGEWRDVLQTYASYGVNCMRFHSHCPPDAAFDAADELGMLMQPELSHWDPYHAFESAESLAYYRLELEEIIRAYGHHPSFVMLSLGNELHANGEGVVRMHELVSLAHTLDDTRLYAWGSNNFYGGRIPDPESDFCTAMNSHEHMLRCTSSNMVGRLNQAPPATDYTFDAGVEDVRKTFSGPIFGFEVGQYEVLPDFDELADFHGVTRAVNYDIVRRRVAERGLMPMWKRMVEATGEMSLQCYREEVEAALRTRGMSGLSLLGLQDFPGQGTALVGMLNAHLRPKPFDFARPERFAAFYRPVLPLAMLKRRCFAARETVEVGLALANYGKEELTGPLRWRLFGGGHELAGETLPRCWKCGQVTDAEAVRLPLRDWTDAAELTLTLDVGPHHNEYSLWVYPDAPFAMPAEVLVTADVGEAVSALRQGGRVLLSPPATKEAIPGSITSQFSPDFWSVGNFPQQEGAMGCLMDVTHPIFTAFPTRYYSTFQWWPMTRGRAIAVPDRCRPVMRVLDCYKFLRSFALLAEFRVGPGRLMLSGMGLLEQQDFVEVRALTDAILRYMAGNDFQPADELTEAELEAIFTADRA